MSKKKVFDKVSSAILCAALLASFSSCRESPESSLVVHKDLDKLIEEATTPDTDKVEIGDLVEKYDSYVTTIENESLGVTVNVDAKVDIPVTDHLSVFRVEQKKFTQELVDKVRAQLLGDTALYDGCVLMQKTKSYYERNIATLKEGIVLDDANPLYSEEDKASLRERRQKEIDKYQEEYETAPDEIIVTDIPSDAQLHKVEEKYREAPDDPFYSWLYDFNEKGDVLNAVSDGKDGTYSSLYVQNCEDKSNKLRFRKNKIYYETFGGVMVQSTDLTPLEDLEDTYPENFLSGGMVWFNVPELTLIPGESAELSLEDAVAVGDEFLKKIGIEGFEYYEGGLFSEYLYLFGDYEYMNYYRPCYILRYYRNIDNAFLTQASGTKRNMGDPEKGDYNKLDWPGECIEFRINDNGIVGFDYNAPLNIIETVVDNSALKSFEDIRETFEKMMPVTKASEDDTRIFKIDRVRLSYSRISEADSFDTGLIVPVWDFWGSFDYAHKGQQYYSGSGSLLSINAIDGTIIDPNLGY